MKCFNHHNMDAIGLCKACNKGLCPECAVEVNNSIACKSTCEEEVKTIDKLIKKTKVTAEAQRKNRMFMPSFFLVTGGIILLTSYVRTRGFGLPSLMGFSFLAFGVALIFINRKWIKDMEFKA